MANEPNSFSCSICLNEYNKPKIINCYHTFCESCLGDYVAQAATNNKFACPLCRMEITVPDGGVKDFSANFYITDTPQVSPQQPVEIQQTSRHMCTLHLRERDIFCCNCCDAVCSECFLFGHPGHSREPVHDVENILIRKLTQLREDIQANILKDQETVASGTRIRNKQPFKKKESRACLSVRIKRNEALERRISKVLANHNLYEMLDEISIFGLILGSARNELNTTHVVSHPTADTNRGELLAEDKEEHATESDELDEGDDLNSLVRLPGEYSPNVRTEDDGGRVFESDEPNYNLQPEDLNDNSSHGPDISDQYDLLDFPVPRQIIYFHCNTIIQRFDINVHGKKNKSLSSPTFDILGELWSLECKYENRHQCRKSLNLRISLKHMSSSSSSILAKFTMVLNARRTEPVVNENGFNFTRRSNIYQCFNSQIRHSNSITLTVIFHEVQVPSSSGIYISRVPVAPTPIHTEPAGLLILFVLGLILIKILT
ncbi:tripartite motif-containing protein 43C [Patella vulgata]|uniref:tripartite motif-containing protein 43C n=1 Tax=Patella vulgata TaxID=6465 RepID=UPI0021802DA9|nr:tripartite motif-containing protein 43C [Patella vulgata]